MKLYLQVTIKENVYSQQGAWDMMALKDFSDLWETLISNRQCACLVKIDLFS